MKRVGALALLLLAACFERGPRSLILPVVVDAPGREGRVWRTALVVAAADIDRATEVELGYFDRAGRSHRARLVLPPGGGQRIDDLFGWMRRFAVPPPAAGSEIGYLELRALERERFAAAVEIAAFGADGRRVAQRYAAADLGRASESPRRELRVDGLPVERALRLNLGLVNPSDFEASVDLELRDFESGAALTNPEALRLFPHRLETRSDLLAAVPMSEDVRALSVVVRQRQGRGDVLAYVSVLDPRTEGGAFVPARPSR